MSTPTGTPAEIFAAYTRWLERQPLAANTRRTYRVQVAPCCVHLATVSSDAGDPLREQHAATDAVRDDRPHRDPGTAEAEAAGEASTGFPFR
ncbi:MAG: hypothetical protein M3Y58_10835 [Chloroflexota bacterium]|nr:hypothetical protein [Chloroflexota bacterium]